MNILITGSGLIGANAARHATDAGHKVVLFDLSLGPLDRTRDHGVFYRLPLFHPQPLHDA